MLQLEITKEILKTTVANHPTPVGLIDELLGSSRPKTKLGDRYVALNSGSIVRRYENVDCILGVRDGGLAYREFFIGSQSIGTYMTNRLFVVIKTKMKCAALTFDFFIDKTPLYSDVRVCVDRVDVGEFLNMNDSDNVWSYDGARKTIQKYSYRELAKKL